jgi:putative aldouronate transport system substrate-binding protein
MKEVKRVFKILAVALFSLILLVACQSEKTSKKAENTKETEEESKEPLKFSISMRTLAFTHVENSPNINEDEYVKELEKLTNTDLDIRLMPHNEYSTKMDLMFASGDIPDVVQTSAGYGEGSGQTLQQAVEAGVFLPLDELIEKHGPNLKKYIPEAAWEKQRYKDGKIYSIPEYLSNPSRRATYIRKDLLDKAGLEVPKTVEETLTVLRKFKEMGVAQPFGGRADFKYADTFFGSFDVFPYSSMWELDKDGNPVPKFFDSKNMESALKTYKTMYDEGLLHKEFLTIDSKQYKNEAITGNIGMWSMNANELLQWEQQLKENVPDAEIAVVPSPVGPDGKGGYYLYGDVTRAYAINKETENPEKIIKFFDWMLSEDAAKYFTYGIEGKDYTMENGKMNYKTPQSVDEVNIERYRTAFLWLVQDTTYIKGLLEMTPEGQELIEVYDTILANEGRDGINFDPPLKALDTLPDLQPGSDTPPKLLMGHMAKMITGAEPISDWSKVVEEWKERGGNKVLEEAADRYKKKEFTESRRK